MIAGPEMPQAGSWRLPDSLCELAAVENGAFIADLIEEFKTGTALSMQVLRNAMTLGDSKRVRSEIHSIKGGARQMGGDAMADLCEEIELLPCDSPARDLLERVNRLGAMFEALCREMGFVRH